MNDPLREQLQTALGRAFTLERELDGGGMSRVFVAREEALGRDVVVNVLAPEQAAGDDVDQRADLYAWGVVAYELLAGRHPFADRTTAQQLVAAHITESPRPLQQVAPAVPPAHCSSHSAAARSPGALVRRRPPSRRSSPCSPSRPWVPALTRPSPTG